LYYGVQDALPQIEGWLSDAQGRFLCDAAAATTGRGAIVEIGSWKGRSTAWLATGAKRAGGRVYAIDPHQGSREDPCANTLAEFLDNMRKAGVSDAVEPMIMTSAEAAAVLKGPVELLFIDGDHSDSGAERDAALWLSRVPDRGMVLLHDVATAGYTGPRRVFRHQICWSAQFDSITRIGSMGVARRTTQRSFSAALWGTAAGFLLYIYDLKRAWKTYASALKAAASNGIKIS
jgi:predicted O-methyltransferase YrrM